MSRTPADIGRALKSVADSYIEDRPADAAAVRAGVERYRRRRFRFVTGGAVLATGTAALLVYLVTASTVPEERSLPPAGRHRLTIAEEVPIDGSPLQVAAKENVAWVTRLNEDVISRVEVGAANPVWQKTVGAVPADIVATGDGLWIADRANNQIVQLDPETGVRVRAWELPGPPGRISVGTGAVRAAVDGVGVVRIDRVTGDNRWIYEDPVLDIAMGEHAFWVLNISNTIAPIDPDNGNVVAGLSAAKGFAGEGEITYLRGAIWYGVEGNPTLLRIDEASGRVTERLLLPDAYQDIDADADGLWALVRNGRLGRLVGLDPATGAVIDEGIELDDDPVDIVTGDEGVWVALASGGRVVLVR